MRQQFNAARALLAGAGRYRWHAMLAAWLLALVGWAVVMTLPNKFESRAKVFVDTSTALTPVMEGLAIQQDLSARLDLVQQSLVGDEQLGRVIDETTLGRQATSDEERDELREELRDSIEVTLDAASTSTQAPSGLVYWLSYRDPDRERSLQVVQMLVDSLVKGTVGGNLEDAEAARAFLTARIREYEQRLAESEQRLAEFKKQNIGAMPGEEGDYYTRLQNEIDAARKARELLSVAVSRRDELSRQLRDGSLLTAAASAGPAPTVTLPGGQTATGGDTLTQLADAQAKLDALLRTYTEKHPDVAWLREQIATLQKRRQEELAALRRGDDEAVLSSGVTSNPVYQAVRLQLNQADVEVAALRRELGGHEAKVAELRQLVNSVPEVEAELTRLTRDYDLTKSQYAALVDRLEKAKLGQRAEKADSGIRFEILDAPRASLQPVSPRRPPLVAAIFVGSLLAGAALAVLLHLLHPVYDQTRDLEQETGIPVLGVVSLMGLEERRRADRRSYRRVSMAAAALVAAFAIVLLRSLSTGTPAA